MACVYIPDALLGILKLVIIMFFFGCITMTIVLICSRQTVMDNWDEYKCNPLVTPFASFFGKDSTQTMRECSSMVFEGQSINMMGPMVGIFGNIAGALGSLGGIMMDLNFASSSMAGIFGTGLSDLLSKLGNAGSAIQYLILKLQTLLQRLVATVLVMLYSMASLFQGVVGISNDPAFLGMIDAVTGFA